MNNRPTDPWESEMSREFDKRVRDLHEAPLTFDNVKDKAMTIRRNRRIAVAGGILAAAAVVVPVAILAGNGLGDSNDTIDPVVSPSPTRATDTNDPTPPTEAPISGVGVGYLEGSAWHRADGSTVELDSRYDGGTEVDDRLLATRNVNGKLTIDEIEADGSVSRSLPALSYPVANADHTTAAFIDADGVLVTLFGDQDVLLQTGLVDGDSVATLIGGPDCAEVADGCTAYINHGNGDAPELLDSHGIRDVVTPDAIAVSDVAPDRRVAAQTSFADAGSCSEVTDAQGRQVFETCDAYLYRFSPDGGAYLSGTHPYLDGIGNGYATILDATNGEELARFTPKEGFVREQVWEDSEHLLVNTFEQGEWRVYRLGVDGSSEQVLSSTEGDDLTPAFTLLS